MVLVGVAHHCQSLRHVVHAVGSVHPRLDDYSCLFWQLHILDKLLDLGIGKTRHLDLMMKVWVDVGVAALEYVVRGHRFLIEVDLEFVKRLF